MKLMMVFGNEIIDLIKINKSEITPSYLLNLKEELIGRNEENLNTASDEPQFAIGRTSATVRASGDYTFI